MADEIQTPQGSTETSPKATLTKEQEIQAALDEKYPKSEVKPLKIDKRSIAHINGRRKETVLDNSTFEALLFDLACNKPIGSLCKHYKIGFNRINNIIIECEQRIKDKRLQVALSTEKKFLTDTILKRDEIISNITEKDIKKASLHAKTGAIVDLTNVKRLEAGQSTVNAEIISKEMSIDDLKGFILNGVNEPNKRIVVNENNIVNENEVNKPI